MNNIRMLIHILKFLLVQSIKRFRFKVNRWLSEEKDDKKTYVDIVLDEQQAPPSSPVPRKGKKLKNKYKEYDFLFVFNRSS